MFERDHLHDEHDHGHGAHHGHDDGDRHRHVHDTVDPRMLSSQRGIRAVQLSFAGLLATTLLQLVVVFLSGSVALLADTIHNFADASTAIPLGVAFALGRRKPTERFTYGYGRVEDLAGVAVVLTILASAIFAGYESISRFIHPREVQHLAAVAVASLIGFAGNEGVAVFRIKTGREIGSAALIADGYHARTDGLASLSVLISAAGIALGFPLADPIIGLLMTGLILKIVSESAMAVLMRLLDAIDPQLVGKIREAASRTPNVLRVADVRLRWLGHRLHCELSIAVNPEMSVREGHDVAVGVRHRLLHHVPFLSGIAVHIDPSTACGEEHHALPSHDHDGLGVHRHH
jgi:cation diffusion facilitator family transporter